MGKTRFHTDVVYLKNYYIDLHASLRGTTSTTGWVMYQARGLKGNIPLLFGGTFFLRNSFSFLLNLESKVVSWWE